MKDSYGQKWRRRTTAIGQAGMLYTAVTVHNEIPTWNKEVF